MEDAMVLDLSVEHDETETPLAADIRGLLDKWDGYVVSKNASTDEQAAGWTLILMNILYLLNYHTNPMDVHTLSELNLFAKKHLMMMDVAMGMMEAMEGNDVNAV